jgi:hypothetical protein
VAQDFDHKAPLPRQLVQPTAIPPSDSSRPLYCRHHGAFVASALKRLKKSAGGYQSTWDRPWEQLRCAVDPFRDFTNDQASAHFFGEGNEDYRDRPCYVSAFLAGALETWGELEPEVESEPSPTDFEPDDPGDALVLTADSPEPPSAHCAVQAADAEQAIPVTDSLPVSVQRDAVTLALAAVIEAPAPPADSPPPRVRPTLSIVRAVVDTYTTAREWLARERPIELRQKTYRCTPMSRHSKR